jgi:hypothetical protein
MGKSKRGIVGACLPLFLMLLSPGLAAQEAPGGYVFYSEGEDFVLTIDGRRQIYRAEGPGEAGFDLAWGDMIQTGAESMVEIQMIPSAAVIKAAENTSVVFNGPRGSGETLVLTLHYGRLRLVTGGAMGGTELVVLAGNTETAVRGDVGIDFVVPSGEDLGAGDNARPKLYVFAFSGAADLRLLTTARGGPRPDIPALHIKEQEVVSLETAASLSIIERKPLDRAALRYWEDHNFKGHGPLLMPDTLLPAPGDSLRLSSGQGDESPAALPDFSAFRRRQATKNISLLSGLSLTAVGGGLNVLGFSAMNGGNIEYARYTMIAGNISIGLGLLSLLFSLLVNPSLPQ